MKFIKTVLLLAALSAFSFSGAYGQQHQISLIYTGKNQMSVHYSASDKKPTTGVGFRLHFDSGMVDITNITLLLFDSNLGVQLMEDLDDADGNPRTDFYINAAWVDLSGQWPGADTKKVNLYEIEYDAQAADAIDLFTVTATSTMVGYEFLWEIQN